MQQSQKPKDYFLKILLLHALLGLAVFYVRPLSFVYAAGIFLVGCYAIVKSKNRNNEALYWMGYIVAAEVFLRMTKGNIGNEFGKYCVLVFSLLGLYCSGVSKRATPYFIFLIAMIPGVVYGIMELSFDANIRKALVFNLLGPLALGVAALYTCCRTITLQDMEKLTRWMVYPMIPMLVYLFLYNPDIRAVITGTDSNSATSGGFGPNQVSTILGLGMFLAFTRLLYFSKTLFWQMFHLLLLMLFTYRGVITFSRGGVITGIAMIVVLVGITFLMVSNRGRAKITFAGSAIVVLGFVVFTYSIVQTGGMILNRYKGEDALGREKASKLSGREVLIESELNMFYEHPIMGVGVGRNKEYREAETGILAASHNEISRMLAEHGILGVVNLILLLLTPFVLYFQWNKQHVFMLSFWIFWLLTINHAAMRIAAPAFVYALSLLNVQVTNDEKNTLHREPGVPSRTE